MPFFRGKQCPNISWFSVLALSSCFIDLSFFRAELTQTYKINLSLFYAVQPLVVRMRPPTLPLPSTITTGAILHWFRRDLRIHDNLALNHALSLCKKHDLPLIPLYVLDPNSLNTSTCGPVRARFVLQSIRALQKALLQKCEARLRIVRGRPDEVIPELLTRWNVLELTFEEEYSPDEKERDSKIRTHAKELDVSVVSTHGFLMYSPDKLLKEAKGKVPVNMGSFLTLIRKIGDPDQPKEFADREAINLTKCEDKIEKLDSQAGYFLIPSLGDLGQQENGDEDAEIFPGGEEEALKRMNEFLKRKGGQVAARFAKPRTNPAALWPRETTVLSPYLALGCLSSRLFCHKLFDVYRRYSTDHEMPQVTLWGQLLWREHFWLLAHTTKDFHTMRGNRLCRIIDWDDNEQSRKFLKAWTEAKTGYPWIDALMTQLKKEGFVHHLGRHSLACFLTRGDLWVSWEEGYKVFEKYLIDYDYALNSANWMWLSCSAFFIMYYRVYSPVAFAKKWDKDGEFIKHYLPVLKKMPTKYIHEPWKAPINVQRAAGCVVGDNYPERIVDHREVSKENIARMKQNYARKQFGGESQAQNDSRSSKKQSCHDRGNASCTDNDTTSTLRGTKRRKTKPI